MKNLRMKNGFQRMSDAELSTQAGSILTHVKDNPFFPDPTPSIEAVSQTLTAYQAALSAAGNRDLLALAVKNQRKTELVAQLHMLANYVLFKAAGQLVIAKSSGFSVSSERHTRPPLTEPESVVLSSGANRGEILMKLRRVPNVLGYRYEMTTHPVTADSQWQTVLSTISKNLFKGLTSGQEYSFRVAAIGPKNQVVYSSVVSRVAL